MPWISECAGSWDSEHRSVQVGVERLPREPAWLETGTRLSLLPTVTVLCGTRLTIHRAPFPRWLLNLFHSKIESNFRKILESKVRMFEPRKGWAQVILGPDAQRGQIICRRSQSWCAIWEHRVCLWTRSLSRKAENG